MSSCLSGSVFIGSPEICLAKYPRAIQCLLPSLSTISVNSRGATTLTFIPVSSSTSRSVAMAPVSPNSTCPPGRDHAPGSVLEFKERLTQAYISGVDGVAIDGEAYSSGSPFEPSKIWSGKSYTEAGLYGQKIKQLFYNLGLEMILLPENLGGEKYKSYDAFIEQLRPSKILMERTYQQPEPWNMIFYWLKNKKYPCQKILGIWQDATPPLWRPIQRFMARWLSGTVFYYSERRFYDKQYIYLKRFGSKDPNANAPRAL